MARIKCGWLNFFVCEQVEVAVCTACSWSVCWPNERITYQDLSVSLDQLGTILGHLESIPNWGWIFCNCLNRFPVKTIKFHTQITLSWKFVSLSKFSSRWLGCRKLELTSSSQHFVSVNWLACTCFNWSQRYATIVWCSLSIANTNISSWEWSFISLVCSGQAFLPWLPSAEYSEHLLLIYLLNLGRRRTLVTGLTSPKSSVPNYLLELSDFNQVFASITVVNIHIQIHYVMCTCMGLWGL